MKSEHLILIVVAGLLGAIVGPRLHDHFNSHPSNAASLMITVVPSSLLATIAWALIARPGNILIALVALLIASSASVIFLHAFALPLVLSPIAVLATGWVVGNTLRRWIPIDVLPILGLVLGLAAVIILWVGANRGYWQPDTLLPIGFLSCAWVQALALEGTGRLLLLLHR